MRLTAKLTESDLVRDGLYRNRRTKRLARLVSIFPLTGVEYRYVSSGETRGRGEIVGRTNTVFSGWARFLASWERVEERVT